MFPLNPDNANQFCALLAITNIVQLVWSGWLWRARHAEERLTRDSAVATSAAAAATDELAFVRDMLELRTLTDVNFSTPQEMLQGFLGKLAMLSGFERGSLFLREAEDNPRLQHAASGGCAVTPAENEDWAEGELRILRDPLAESTQVAHVPQELLSEIGRGRTCRLQGALLIPIVEDQEVIGCLLLSSRNSVQAQVSDADLANWAAQFILQTFERAIERVQIEEEARHDALTQLANRRTFDIEFEKLNKHCMVNNACCSLLLVDVDHFKSVNDTNGHRAGDAVLREMAQVLLNTVQRNRVSDRPLVARYGGEEFAILIPDLALIGAKRIAEELRLAVAEHDFCVEDLHLKVTISLGIGSCPDHGYSSSDLIEAADAGLYSAKNRGRNRVGLVALKLLES